MMTPALIARTAAAAPRRLRLAAAATGLRAHSTRPDALGGAPEQQLDPIEIHRFMQSRGRQPREFLEIEAEVLASESFLFDSSAAHAHRYHGPSAAAAGKDVNGEFARQIQDLLRPDYGAESH